RRRDRLDHRSGKRRLPTRRLAVQALRNTRLSRRLRMDETAARAIPSLDLCTLAGSRRRRTSPIAIQLTRRRFMAVATIGASMSIGNHFARAQASAVRFDLGKPLDGWTTASGKWALEDV